MSEPFEPGMSALVGFVWSVPAPMPGAENLCPQEHDHHGKFLLIPKSDDHAICLDHSCVLFNHGHGVTVLELLRMWLDGRLDDPWLEGRG
jgi:hypothetical protein